MTEAPKIDITGWRPVVIGKGRGKSRQWLLIGYAGKASKGMVPIALIDGTDCGTSDRGRGLWLTLSWRAGVAGLVREATQDEVERRAR